MSFIQKKKKGKMTKILDLRYESGGFLAAKSIVELTYCKGWALLHLEGLFSQDESFSIGQICDRSMIFSFALCQS